MKKNHPIGVAAYACACAATLAGPGAAVAEEVVAFHTLKSQIVVTGTREKELLSETPESIGTIDEETIREVRPTHPSQIMGQIPGVAVAVTNGEGHTTAIRQPFTTNPVYLYLEDGVPIRSTGFFNHNSLYEIDIPAAGGIEVIRGPGTALYGSDAIGGIVNVLSRTPPVRREAYVAPDFGSFGWRRLIFGGGDSLPNDGWRADANITHTDGWRDSTAYDRYSAGARWDHSGDNNINVRSVLSYSHIDQQTGANSPLIEDDYRNHPTKNYLPIAFRKVEALRLYSAWEREFGGTLISVTPYVRDNSMDLLASFTLNSDPTVAKTSNYSYGALAKIRQDYGGPMRPRVIAGLDVDVSPGSREEDRLNVNPTGSGASRVFDSYTTGPRVYDYDVTFHEVSPYVHGEISPIEKLRVVAGLRFDSLWYDFDNNFDPTPIRVPGAFPGLRFYGQAADTTKRFNHTSPKFGMTYELTPETSVFFSYNHGFRVPSEGQLFRPSAATSVAAAQVLTDSALQLQPIRAVQTEIGIRGHLGPATYDAVVYDLEKKDDILTFRDNATNFTQTVNAGHTSHKGIELGLNVPIMKTLMFDGAFSYARHKYENWVTSGGDFTGHDIESAPHWLTNARLTWLPVTNARLTGEWVHISEYWMDAANTTKYGGHSLFNVRGNYTLTKNVDLFASITNLTDRRYADSASISSSTPVFSPGLPRAYYAGVTYKW